MQSWFCGEQLNKHVEILNEKAQFSLSTQWRHRGEKEMYLHSFLTLALDGA